MDQMAEQQGICLLALKMAKVFLAASKCILCMLAANRYKTGRGRGVVTVLVAALQSQVQKQGVVCAGFI